MPDCTLYSHAASTTTTTGFLVKFNDNGDETQRGNKNRKFTPSITGTLVAPTSTIGPCTGTADSKGTQHVMTGVLTTSSACSTSPRGCSCVVLNPRSTINSNTPSADSADGDGPLSAWSGMRIRITQGTGAGYDGVISAFRVADKKYNTIPALSVQPDET